MSKGSGYIHHQESKLGGGGKYWQAAPLTQQVPLNGTTGLNSEQQA